MCYTNEIQTDMMIEVETNLAETTYMRFQIPKRTFVDRGRDKGKSKPRGFRLPSRLLNDLEIKADEYGYPVSLFVSLILDGYLGQIQPTTRIKPLEGSEKKDLVPVSYRLDNALYGQLKGAAKARGLAEGDLVSIAVLSFLKAI